MKDLKQGKEYYISSLSKKDALSMKDVREFACYDKIGRAYFHKIDSSNGLIVYTHAVEIPEPNVEAWTRDTFPLDDAVWVQHKQGGGSKLITDFDDTDVWVGVVGYVTYEKLKKDFNRIMPDRSIAPCGSVV